MKKRYLLLSLSLLLLNYSQGILWEKSHEGQHADYLFDAQSTADYGFIFAGSSLSNKIGNKSEDNPRDFDYWVRKIEKVQSSIEAIPNPVSPYTNAIIGYDFTSGTASLVDMIGWMLQKVSISKRTVSVDLIAYADGIYNYKN